MRSATMLERVSVNADRTCVSCLYKYKSKESKYYTSERLWLLIHGDRNGNDVFFDDLGRKFVYMRDGINKDWLPVYIPLEFVNENSSSTQERIR